MEEPLTLENFAPVWKDFVTNLAPQLRALQVKRLGVNLIGELTDQHRLQFFVTFDEGVAVFPQLNKLNKLLNEVMEGEDFMLATESMMA
ncbi:MAG: hypothetical protein AAFO94_22335, partial [Bacteroidota bacterium]